MTRQIEDLLAIRGLDSVAIRVRENHLIASGRIDGAKAAGILRDIVEAVVPRARYPDGCAAPGRAFTCRVEFR